jgi:hypothetical protein
VTVGDYYPEDGELPPGSSEPIHGAPDAASLAASREEMLTYIAGLRARRRRRRLRAVGAFAMFAAVIGVGLLLGTGSGSGGSGERGSAAPRDAWVAAGTPAASGRGVPSNNQTGAFAEMPVGRNAVVGSAYLDQAGDVCSKVANVVKGVTKTYGVGGCTSPRRIAREFSRYPVILTGYGTSPRHVRLHGLARTDVRTLVVHRPSGRSQVAISGPWVPPSRAPADTSVAIKTFLVRVPFVSGDLREPKALRAPTLPGAIELGAVLENGRVQRVRGWWERNRPRVRRLFDPIFREGSPDGSSQKSSEPTT